MGGAQDTLTIEGEKSNDTYFIGVGAINGGTEYGTLKMCDGVTITGATGNNYFGGAVTVAEGGKFEMDGGTIKKCGIDGGSVCFGGGVARDQRRRVHNERRQYPGLLSEDSC